MSGSGVQREMNRTRKVEAAINNEYLTRQRVEQLERRVRALEAEVWQARTFRDRLRWLWSGR